MKACFPKRWTTLKAPPTFTTKVCIKYWKQGHYYAFSSTINWPILTQIHFNNRVDLFLPFMLIIFFVCGRYNVQTLEFCTFLPMKKTSSKAGYFHRLKTIYFTIYFSKFAEIFSTAKKTALAVENSNKFFNVSYTWYKSLIYHKVTHSLNDEKELEQFHRNWTKNWSNQGPSEK